MKKNDIITKEVLVVKGDVLIRNVSKESGNDWIQKYDMKHAELGGEDELNPGSLTVVAKKDYYIYEEATVAWVLDDEACISLKTGGSETISISQDGWKVSVEAAPSFQSSVEHLSVEQLQQKIEELRGKRVGVPVPRKSKVIKPKSSDPVAQMIQGMGKEEREALMKKLGMI